MEENKDSTNSAVGAMNIQDIMEVLPHRYPFLLVDRIVEFVDNEKAVGIKNVSINEPFFQGHFPGRPVMPGVLIIEAMAQVAAVLARRSRDGVGEGKTIFLVGVDEVKFRQMVVPGDQLEIRMVSVRKRRPVWIMGGEVYVNGKLAASGKISAAEAD